MRILALMLAVYLLAPVHTTVEEVAMIAVEGEGTKYWPRWRGPSGQGLAVGSFPLVRRTERRAIEADGTMKVEGIFEFIKEPKTERFTMTFNKVK